MARIPRDEAIAEIAQAVHRLANASRSTLFNWSLVLAVALIAADCLIVAGYQPAVALGLLRHTPPLTLLAGVMVNVGLVVLPVLILARVAWALAFIRDGQAPRAASSLLFTGFFVVVMVCFVPRQVATTTLWSIVLMLLAAALVGWLWRSEPGVGPRPARRILAGASMVVTMGTVISTANATLGTNGELLQRSVARPFVPAEEITVLDDSASTRRIGYVLEVGSGKSWALLLLEKDRELVSVPSERIVDRKVCSLAAEVTRAPLVKLVPTGDTPRCEP